MPRKGYQQTPEHRERIAKSTRHAKIRDADAGLRWNEVWEIISKHLEKGEKEKASAVLNGFMQMRHPLMRARIYNVKRGKD